MRRSRSAGSAAAEEALALLVSGAVKSQAAAAAAVGISEGRLSSVKTQLKPAYYKFRPHSTEVVDGRAVWRRVIHQVGLGVCLSVCIARPLLFCLKVVFSGCRV